MVCEVYFNPACSKCREVRTILERRGIAATYREYLVSPPSREEILKVMALLGIEDPRHMLRTSDALFVDLGLVTASRDAVLDAVVAHPRLIERPIVIAGTKAIVARPPERVEEIL